MPAAATAAAAAQERSDICFLSGAEMAAAIRAGKLTACAALDAVLAQRGRCHPAINAVVVLDAAAARARAAAADAAAARGEWWGPLHGEPDFHSRQSPKIVCENPSQTSAGWLLDGCLPLQVCR